VFNIFDLQNSSGANFNSGACMVVRIDVDYAEDVAPDCPIGGGFTAESNNLNLEGYVRSLGRGLGVANGDLT
jgi:hypothetical protein